MRSVGQTPSPATFANIAICNGQARGPAGNGATIVRNIREYRDLT
jgi:hypothetical protein